VNKARWHRHGYPPNSSSPPAPANTTLPSLVAAGQRRSSNSFARRAAPRGVPDQPRQGALHVARFEHHPVLLRLDEVRHVLRRAALSKPSSIRGRRRPSRRVGVPGAPAASSIRVAEAAPRAGPGADEQVHGEQGLRARHRTHTLQHGAAGGHSNRTFDLARAGRSAWSSATFGPIIRCPVASTSATSARWSAPRQARRIRASVPGTKRWSSRGPRRDRPQVRTGGARAPSGRSECAARRRRSGAAGRPARRDSRSGV
jgi:hypothetical protein